MEPSDPFNQCPDKPAGYSINRKAYRFISRE
jgi:hypothetical protein